MDRLAIAGPAVIAPVTGLMVQHGYADEQVSGILGENFICLFAANWET